MKTNPIRAALACAVFAGFSIAAPNAYAMHGSTWLVGILATVNKDGVPVGHLQTDATGRAELKGLAPGDYEIVIDGPSLVASIDKLAPPAPEKKREGSSFSLGVGGMFGGGGGHSGSGHPGAGPVGGGGSSHGSSSGGGMGVGLSIPIGGSDHGSDQGGTPTIEPIFSVNTDNGKGNLMGFNSGDGKGDRAVSIELPYCRDAASHGIRIKFTIPPGPAASDYTGWYLGFGIGYGLPL